MVRVKSVCNATYLHHQDDHADGSQQVLVVIQPLLHLLEAALQWDRRRETLRHFGQKNAFLRRDSRGLESARKKMFLSSRDVPAVRRKANKLAINHKLCSWSRVNSTPGFTSRSPAATHSAAEC